MSGAPSWAVTTAEDVTPAWLADLVGLPVESVQVTQVGTGQIGTCYRLRPAGDPGLPPSLLLKLPDPGSRELLAGAYRMELMFYDRIAPTLACRVPSVHGSRIEEEIGHFVLLLEDLAPLEQGDQVAGATPAQVPGEAVAEGFTWEERDASTDRWWPQGVTTSADAYGPDPQSGTYAGRLVLLASWYAHGALGWLLLGSRVSVVDLTDPADPRYRHVLLVEPRRRFGLHRQGVQVGDEVERVVVLLQADPLPHRSQVVPEVERLGRRLDAGQRAWTGAAGHAVHCASGSSRDRS